MAKSDDQLAAEAMAGNVESFVTLCRHYYPVIVAIAHAVLADGHLAEDAAQEALAQACRSLRGLKSPERFGPWLSAICRNKARDMLRRNPRLQSLEQWDVPSETTQQDPDVESVRRAMREMPLESRELLYLRYRNDLSYEAIAGLLEISVEAVRGRLHRAREIVRRHVERQRDRRLS